MNLDDLRKLWPIPDLLGAKKVLCIQPHQDDMDVACGGTVARLAESGATVTYLTVTDGGAGSQKATAAEKLADLRRKEQIEAGKVLGVKDYIWLDYSDSDFISAADLQTDLIRAIRRLRPDAVVTVDPWLPYEAHPAHRTVGLAAAAATLLSGMGNMEPANLNPYSVPVVAFALTARPNIFLDVTATWTAKLTAIRCHASQFPLSSWAFYEHYFTAKAAQYGEQVGSSAAEALKVLTPMHLHCNVDAEML